MKQKIISILMAFLIFTGCAGGSVLATGGESVPPTEPIISFDEWYTDYSTYHINKLQKTNYSKRRSIVVFPPPEAPTSPVSCPGSAKKSTLFNTCFPV